MRYETKIPVHGLSACELENVIKMNKVCFRELYPERRVNNLYFDDLNMSSYFENLDGLEKRIKYRIRWYGDQFGLIDPLLELKIKGGQSGYKKKFTLLNFDFRKNTTAADIISYIGSNDLPYDIFEELHLRRPVLFNSYLRKYYISFNKKIRLTLDKGIGYSKIENEIMSNLHYDDLLVLELKYEIEDAGDAQSVINDLPLRIDKNSKYSRGIFYTRE